MKEGGEGEGGKVCQKLCLQEEYWEKGNITFKGESDVSQICSSSSEESLNV